MWEELGGDSRRPGNAHMLWELATYLLTVKVSLYLLWLNLYHMIEEYSITLVRILRFLSKHVF